MTSAHLDHILSQAFALVLFLCHILPVSAETKASGPCICSTAPLHLACIATRFALGLAYSDFPGEEWKRGVSIFFSLLLIPSCSGV